MRPLYTFWFTFYFVSNNIGFYEWVLIICTFQATRTKCIDQMTLNKDNHERVREWEGEERKRRAKNWSNWILNDTSGQDGCGLFEIILVNWALKSDSSAMPEMNNWNCNQIHHRASFYQNTPKTDRTKFRVDIFFCCNRDTSPWIIEKWKVRWKSASTKKKLQSQYSLNKNVCSMIVGVIAVTIDILLFDAHQNLIFRRVHFGM